VNFTIIHLGHQFFNSTFLGNGHHGLSGFLKNNITRYWPFIQRSHNRSSNAHQPEPLSRRMNTDFSGSISSVDSRRFRGRPPIHVFPYVRFSFRSIIHSLFDCSLTSVPIPRPVVSKCTSLTLLLNPSSDIQKESVSPRDGHLGTSITYHL
jgi:hypothetical protein